MLKCEKHAGTQRFKAGDIIMGTCVHRKQFGVRPCDPDPFDGAEVLEAPDYNGVLKVKLICGCHDIVNEGWVRKASDPCENNEPFVCPAKECCCPKKGR